MLEQRSSPLAGFSRTHPDQSPGYVAALSRLEASLARAEQLVIQQGVYDPLSPGRIILSEARNRDCSGQALASLGMTRFTVRLTALPPYRPRSPERTPAPS